MPINKQIMKFQRNLLQSPPKLSAVFKTTDIDHLIRKHVGDAKREKKALDTRQKGI